MKCIKRFIYRKKIKRLQQEIIFIMPLDSFISDQFNWFDLNWRLVRRYMYYTEKRLGTDIDSSEQEIILSNETYSYLQMLLDYIDRNIDIMASYFSQNKSVITFKGFDFSFFEFYFEIIPKISRENRAKIVNHTISVNNLSFFCKMLFFYSEILLRIQGIYYRVKELNTILKK